MSGSKVQSKHVNANGVVSQTITPASALGSGNLMVCHFFGRGGAGSTHAISGTVGTWTKQVTVNDANGFALDLWTCPVTGGDVGATPTITFTQGSSDWMTIIWAELTGVDNSSTPISVSATGAGAGTGTVASAGPTGTSGANQFGLALGQVDGGTTMSADTGSGFTDLELVGTSLPADMAYKTVNATTLTATTIMSGGGDTWVEIAAVFKLAAASGGGLPLFMQQDLMVGQMPAKSGGFQKRRSGIVVPMYPRLVPQALRLAA